MHFYFINYLRKGRTKNLTSNVILDLKLNSKRRMDSSKVKWITDRERLEQIRNWKLQKKTEVQIERHAVAWEIKGKLKGPQHY